MKPDRKAAQSDFHHLVMYAIEELRYIYAGVLADTNITMKVLEVNGGTEKCHILKPLQPTWEEGTMKRLENVPYDLGGGQLTTAGMGISSLPRAMPFTIRATWPPAV